MKSGGSRSGMLYDVYDTLISLILISLTVYAIFTFINSSADGSSYFAKVYALDLASSADLVNAGQGDVILRYDNIDRKLELSFNNRNGRIGVGKESDSQYQELGSGYYGYAQYFAGDNVILTPSFLVLKKSSGRFSITEEVRSPGGCTAPLQPQVPLADAVVYIDIQGTDAQVVKQKFVGVLGERSKITLADTPENAKIMITINVQQGLDNTIVFAPASADGASFNCFSKDRLESLSSIAFAAAEPVRENKEFAVTMTITTRNDVTLTADTIGNAIAQALVLLYRDNQLVQSALGEQK